ncbi:hypothetical protein HNO92_002709 [Chromobacterium alkanivorans]|nr:hypothetical protein [Chromobacterium alkanivorans]MCS3819635.1 hypothetical protein [Chromobacterium alkanivorans]MCS3874390.1 hypothetical protein [Chromobacterium alkanivorans]
MVGIAYGFTHPTHALPTVGWVERSDTHAGNDLDAQNLPNSRALAGFAYSFTHSAGWLRTAKGSGAGAPTSA